MRRNAAALAALVALALGAAGCETRSQDEEPDPRPTSTSASPADVTEHESGPQSPIVNGLQVPRGATQLGPLARYRSARLVQAFQPELDAAEAQVEAEEERRREEAEDEGAPPPSPVPTPETQPERDTFALIENPPRPDVTVSLMRIDGSPTEVFRRMLAQVDSVLPDAGVVTDDIGEYCASQERRITQCVVEARGETADARDLQVTLTVDPGDVETRTSSPSAGTNPVMALTVEYVGDPRSGQLDRDTGDVDVPQDVEGEDTSGLIWPAMDEDAVALTPLLDDWIAPPEATILLSGRRPAFVAVSTDRVREADEIAEDWVRGIGEPGKDVVEDLNEISTTYTATDDEGALAVATYILSARGNYAMMFYSPPAT